jgi:hypothetical protein
VDLDLPAALSLDVKVGLDVEWLAAEGLVKILEEARIRCSMERFGIE